MFKYNKVEMSKAYVNKKKIGGVRLRYTTKLRNHQISIDGSSLASKFWMTLKRSEKCISQLTSHNHFTSISLDKSVHPT